MVFFLTLSTSSIKRSVPATSTSTFVLITEMKRLSSHGTEVLTKFLRTVSNGAACFTVTRKAKRYHQKNMRDGRPSTRRRRRLECTRQKSIQLAVVVTKLSVDRTKKSGGVSKTDKTGCSWSGSGRRQM
jgi:hypothetical protein